MTSLFQRLINELPPGTATIEFAPATERRPAAISLRPANSASAEFWVVWDDREVHGVGFGFHEWEFPYERRYRNSEKDVLTEIEEMARAVVAGNCEQERRRFSMIGRIEVGEYTYAVKDVPKFLRPPFGTRRHAPYSPKSR
ncbi:MAG: hypothetical protein ACRD3F_09330 [Acidobacteriaceae bacterium]